MVRVKVEDALPLVGTVTGLGRLTITPSGEAPLQAASRLTEELKPFTEEISIVEDSVVSGVKLICVIGGGWVIELIEKSGTATGAKTGGVPAILTAISIA